MVAGNCTDYCQLMQLYRDKEAEILSLFNQMYSYQQNQGSGWNLCDYGSEMRSGCLKLMPTEYGFCYTTYYGKKNQSKMFQRI